MFITLPEQQKPVKIGRAPKGKYIIPTMNFQVLLLMAEILHQFIGSLSHYL